MIEDSGITEELAALRASRDLLRALSATSDLSQTAQAILEAACRVEGIDSGGVYLVDQGTGTLQLTAHRGLPPEFVAQTGFYPADAPEAVLVREGRAVYLDETDLAVRMQAPSGRRCLAAGLHSVAVLPVRLDGRVVAVLNLGSHTHRAIPLAARDALEIMAAPLGGALARAQIEAALGRERDFAERLIRTAQVAILVLDLEGRIVRFNPYLEELSGYPLAEVEGQDWCTTFLPEGERDGVRAILRNLTAESPILLHVNLLRTRDGRERLIAWHNAALKSADGRMTALLAVGVDVTEHRHTLEKLTRYQTLADNARDIVLFVRRDGRILEANRAAAAAYGYSAEELKALAVQDLRAPDQRPLAAAQMAQADAAGLLFETRHRRKDGSTFPVEVSSCGIMLAGERVLLSIVRDITERKRVEEALAQRTRQLEAIHAVSAEITRELDLPRLLGLIHRRAAGLLGARAGFVSLYDEATRTLTPRAWEGHGDWVGHLRFRLGEGISGMVAERRQGIVVTDYRSSDHTLPLILDHTSVTSVVAEPLVYRDRLVGVVTVDNEGVEGRTFTEDDRETLARFAVHAAIAIENARLYEAAQHELGQRQAAEEALRTIARVVEQSPNIVLITDAGGAIEYVNPKFTEVTGYSSAEVIGQNPRFLKSGRTSREEYETLWTTILAGNQWRGEFQNRKKNGDLYWEAASISPIRSADGRLTHFVAVKEDITQQRTTETALRDAHELTHQVIASVQEGILVLDGELRYLVWNPYMEALTEMPAAAVLGCSALEVFPFLREAGVPDALRRALRGEVVSAPDLPFCVAPSARAGWVAATLGPLRDAQGVIVGVIGTLRDITAQKQAETVLRQSEGHARRLAQENAIMAEIGRIVSSTLDIDEIYEEFSDTVKKVLPFDRIVISVVDTNQGTVKHVHTAGEPLPDRRVGIVAPLAGSGIAEVVRTRASLLIQTDDFSSYRERFPLLVSTFQAGFRSMLHVPLSVKGEMIGALLLRTRKPNAYTDNDVRLAEKIGAQIAGTIANARLYAERVEADKGRAALEERLRQSQKMEAIGQLAGGVAHDFNNLLTVISGCSDVLLTMVPAEDPKRRFLGDIRDAGERAVALTRQLLAFSRRQVLEPKVLDLNDIVGNLEKMLRRLIGEDIRLTTVLAPGLRRVTVDPGQLEQVVINLAVNARDAMPQGGRLTVETRDAELDEAYCRLHPEVRPGRYVLLSIADTGCGMPADVQTHIFEPFFTTKGPGKGTGLGLATVFGIVKQSDGFIEVKSAVDAGTCFSIYLPAGDAETPASAPDGQTGRVRHGRETILLVEDEATVRRIARVALETHGYVVLEARNGPEAIRIADTSGRPIHLLVSDVVMPEMNGRQLAEHLQGRHAGLKVLFISGYTDDAIVRRGVRTATTAFLQKPFSPLALARKVRDVLDAKGAQ